MILACRPAPALRHVIRYYYQVEERLAGRAVIQPVPARSPQIIEFMFGAPYRVRRTDRHIVETVRPIALVGAQTFRRAELILHGSVDAFTMAFQPAGIATLFSIPAVELTDADFDGGAVLGKTVTELYARLGEVSSFTDRVRVSNEYLSAKRPPADRISGIARIATKVILNDGCVGISELANQTGLGIRQFERRFRYEIGISPKLYSRIVRFEAALRRKAAAPDLLWTDIAHTLGYHDQMHMVHDFNRLSGDNPTTICNQLDMFVRPEVNAADHPHDNYL